MRLPAGPGKRLYHSAWTRPRCDVLDFWFGAPGTPEHGRSRDVWFRKDAAFDDAIRRASATRSRRRSAAASANGAATAEGALARVLLLDQFTRNLFRDTPRAFAGDARALATAQDAIARGFDRDARSRSAAGSCTCRSSMRKMRRCSAVRSNSSARWRAKPATRPAEWAQKHADVDLPLRPLSAPQRDSRAHVDARGKRFWPSRVRASDVGAGAG